MKKPDGFLERIEAYNKAQGGGVIIRRASKGYFLFLESDGNRPDGFAHQLRKI